MKYLIVRDYELFLKELGRPELGAMNWVQPIVARFLAGCRNILDVGGAAFNAGQQSSLPGATVIDPVSGGTAYDLPPCDGAVYSHVLEHLDDPELAINELARVLHGPAVFYSPFPGNPSWDPTLQAAARVEHLWQPNPVSLCRLLVMHGFTIEYAEWRPDEHHSFLVVGRHP